MDRLNDQPPAGAAGPEAGSHAESELTARLATLLRRLEDRIGPWRVEELAELLSTPFRLEDVVPWLVFDPEHYARNTVRRGRHFELLVICREPGQATAVHDHGDSECVVRVLQGTLHEQRYSLVAGEEGERPGSAGPPRRFARGELLRIGPAGVHRVDNPREADARAVSLHVYSPPLEQPMLFPGEEAGV